MNSKLTASEEILDNDMHGGCRNFWTCPAFF